jgi:adenine-specific DNA-methyltransferase
VATYILWYARDIAALKFRRLYQPLVLGESGATRYLIGLTPNGDERRLTAEEVRDPTKISDKARPLFKQGLTSRSGGASTQFAVQLRGKSYRPTAGGWRTNEPGMEKLLAANRVTIEGNRLTFRRFFDDFPATPITSIWDDISGGIKSRSDPKVYAVQTATAVVERCMLMTTDPGDLVFDPTCGSGTTAFVAEQWGRRWITCDTSRVAITLAKQRLMTAVFDYYTLSHPAEGVGSGFVYKTVPHVTLKSIANNPEIKEGLTRAQIDAAITKYAERETLYDQPELDRSKARVTGPFTVEAVPAVTVRPIDEEVSDESRLSLRERTSFRGAKGDFDSTSVARFGETARQRQWRDELQASGIRGKGGQIIRFARLEPCSAVRHIHAIGETTDNPPKSVAVSFGPEYAPLEQRQVEQAWEDARTLLPKPQILMFAAFHFDPEAAKDIDELDAKKTGMLLLRAQMNTDLLTDDLKKKRSSNESFWLIGQPDVTLRQLKTGEHKGQWQVEVNGFDYYDPVSGKIESGSAAKIAVWLLDSDYDGRSLYPRQVFFPMAGDMLDSKGAITGKDGWSRLAKTLKAEVDPDLMADYHGTVSLPFEPGKHQRIAVKIVDDRGIESLKVVRVE